MNTLNAGMATVTYCPSTQPTNKRMVAITNGSLEDEIRERLKLDYTHMKTAFKNGTYGEVFENEKATIDSCIDFVTQKGITSYDLTELMDASIGVTLTLIKVEMEKYKVYDQRFIDLIKSYQQLRKLIGSHHPYSTLVDATFTFQPQS